MLRNRGVFACSALLVAVFTAALPARAAVNGTISADELVGLWKAKKRFGPDARGTLIIQKGPQGWTADFVGRILPVRLEGTQLKFELPNGQGSFNGRVPQANGGITGHWLQETGQGFGGVYASPITLAVDGPARWRGEVVPRNDTFTFYLKVEKRPDGSLGTFLRNPDRNIGMQLNVERLVLEGNAVKLLGKASGKGEERSLIGGQYDAQNQVLLLDIPWSGDNLYRFTRDDDDSSFYPHGKNPGRYIYRPPLSRDDGWPTATLDEIRISRAGIEKFIQRLLDMPMESLHTPQVDAVLVARHGKLAVEEYFHGFNRDMLHDTRSAAKSLTATVVGAAIQAGALELSSPVYQVMNGGSFPPGLEPRKRAMTLEHLLMMRSGYFCDDSNPDAPGNEEVMGTQTEQPDNYLYTLAVPMAQAPDEISIYCSAVPNLALGMVGHAMGESPMDTFDRLLGRPLKVERYAWNLDRVGHPFGGDSVQMLPRDFMKLGQLMLNGGTWNGQRILGRDFVARAGASLHDLKRMKYGYLWWSYEFPYKNRTVHGFWAGGNGGQGVMVFPELDLVVATFAGNYADPVGLHIQQDLPVNYILPAVREAGDDMNAPVIEGHFKTPYGLPGVLNPR